MHTQVTFTDKTQTLPVDPATNKINSVDINELKTVVNVKADLDSPAFVGTPTAPTAASTTNTTQVATTAFVKSQTFDFDEDQFEGKTDPDGSPDPIGSPTNPLTIKASVLAGGGGTTDIALLQSITLANDTEHNINLNTHLAAGYKSFEIEILGLVVTAGNVCFRLSPDGVTYNTGDAEYRMKCIDHETPDVPPADLDGRVPFLQKLAASPEQHSAYLKIANIAATTLYPLVTWQAYSYGWDAANKAMNGKANLLVAQATHSIKIYHETASGLISGLIRVWGKK